MNSRTNLRTRLSTGAAVAGLALLAACGGGGGSTGSTPTPPRPTPTPTPIATPTPGPAPTPTPPAPTPTPTPTSTVLRYVAPPLPSGGNYNDGEFQRSRGPRFHGAPTAWVQGATGQGRTIAVIDTGIFAADPEFAGRVSSNSTGINGNSSFEADHSAQQDSLHGTEVAMIAAAANNGAGIVGIAYDATIMAIRADDPGSCASDGGCEFGDVSDGIEWAVEHGATVINLSMGGSNASSAERAAVAAAAAAGVVVVVAAGNDGPDNDPDSFAKSLADLGEGNVIIVGSVDSGGQLSNFSNSAGGHSEYYIAALGRVFVDETNPMYETQGQFNIAGTSFAAPQVAGAVALLKQAFPHLTAAQLVDRLIDSAQDVGVPGDDELYGSGILDIHRAFQALGTTSLPNSTLAFRPGDDTGVTSPAMGDALAGGVSLQTFVLDRDKIAFKTDIGSRIGAARLSERLNGAVGQQQRFVSLGAGKAAVAFTIDSSGEATKHWPRQLMLSREDADNAKVLAARVAMKLSPSTDIGFAYSESADGLVGQMQGQDRPAFLIAHSATGDDGLFRTTDAAFALRRKLGKLGLTLSAEGGQIVSAGPLMMAEDMEARQQRDGVRSFALAADRQWGALEGSLGLTWMDEDRTVLGARFHDGFGASGAQTAFVDAHAGFRFADGWRLGGALRQGFTRPNAGGIVSSDSLLVTRAWSIDLQRQGVFGAFDSIGLRIAQPLRVEQGGLALNLPVGFSYDTLEATYETRTLSLSPQGRELMGEIAWRGPFLGGFGSASLFYRRDPGHYASVPDDKGVALRWNTEF